MTFLLFSAKKNLAIIDVQDLSWVIIIETCKVITCKRYQQNHLKERTTLVHESKDLVIRDKTGKDYSMTTMLSHQNVVSQLHDDDGNDVSINVPINVPGMMIDSHKVILAVSLTEGLLVYVTWTTGWRHKAGHLKKNDSRTTWLKRKLHFVRRRERKEDCAVKALSGKAKGI